MFTSLFSGCRPTPLASYLKALGIIRILSRQFPEASPQGRWEGNTFVLSTTCDSDAIQQFFLQRYAPSPIVAPWNGGSGFYPKDNATALKAISASEAGRFAAYRETIERARDVINSLALREKPEKEIKEALLLRCRNTFPDLALEWLDSAFVLTEAGAKYPPLLGTGGNDGRLEFTNNFMQRITEIFDPASGEPAERTAGLLANALFDSPIKGLEDCPIGQFSPAASGGTNASTGFDAKSAVNPWDFIFALEGAMLFAAAAVKRLEGFTPGQLVYPFCVNPSGSGYGTAADSDEKEARCEIWVPLWKTNCGISEIETLFNEGRAWVGKRPAKNGVDFAMAVATLGVDRGISEFQRYGFHVRNGLSYFATPLQRLSVQRDGVVADLLSTCDSWLNRFLYEAKKEHAPSSIGRAANRLESAILSRIASSQQSDPSVTQELLIALGECERTIAGSEKWREESNVSPIPPLPRHWVQEADTGSPEFRLAASLASLTHGKGTLLMRQHLEPVTPWGRWDEKARNDVMWNEGPVDGVLRSIMKRRIILANSASADSWPERSSLTAWPSDIAAFIEGRIDEERFAQLLWGLSLINFASESATGNMPGQPERVDLEELPPAFYSQLKLCFASGLPGDKKIPVEAAIFNLAASGDGERASAQALRRLHGSSVPILHLNIPLGGEAARRCAAALLFPLWKSQLRTIGKVVAPKFFEINHTH